MTSLVRSSLFNQGNLSSFERYKMDVQQLTLKGESALDLAKITHSEDVVSYLEMLIKLPLGVDKV